MEKRISWVNNLKTNQIKNRVLNIPYDTYYCSDGKVGE